MRISRSARGVVRLNCPKCPCLEGEKVVSRSDGVCGLARLHGVELLGACVAGDLLFQELCRDILEGSSSVQEPLLGCITISVL